MTDSDSTALWQQHFLGEFRQQSEQSDKIWSKQSIYRIPSLLRNLDPKAYEPCVVSIGPYHYGKEQLEAMKEHKHRALLHFRTRAHNIPIEVILACFREGSFLDEVKSCYAKPLDTQWSDDIFLLLMVLDGSFVLELLLSASRGNNGIVDPPPTEWSYTKDDPIFGDDAERHGVVPYVKMDMLLLENQIPLIVLEKLAGIANLVVDINWLVWSLYCCDYQKTPSNDRIGLHVLDVYRKGRLCFGNYNGWGIPESAKELNYSGVRFVRSSGRGSGDGFVGIGSFKDVAFVTGNDTFYDYIVHYCALPLQGSPQLDFIIRMFPRFMILGASEAWVLFIITAFRLFINFNLTSLMFLTFWWYLPLWVSDAKFSLPHLTIDETTSLILLNLMAFERLHLGLEVEGKDMAVTRYVFLMSSLIRSEKDVELLRKESILLCLAGWSDESVVKLFADLTRNVVSNEMMNEKIEALYKKRSNRTLAAWRRHFSSDLKTWITVLLAAYGVLISLANTCMAIASYFVLRKNPSRVACN